MSKIEKVTKERQKNNVDIELRVENRKKHFIKRMRQRYKIAVDENYMESIIKKIKEYNWLLVHPIGCTKLKIIIEIHGFIVLVIYGINHNDLITVLPIDRSSMVCFLNKYRKE